MADRIAHILKERRMELGLTQMQVMVVIWLIQT